MLDPGRGQLTNPFNSLDGIGYRTHNYNSWEAMNTAQSYSGFGTGTKEVHDSGISSPPLWKTSPPRSTQHRQNHYRSLSPTSRSQAIARGQRELMDMVRNMPESCYELSLKDLVEHPMAEVRQESREDERNSNSEIVYMKGKSKKMIDHKAKVTRNGNIQSGGFYLKMVFPTSLSLGSKKKNNNKIDNNSAKVSPRPSISDGSAKGVDKEWWKKHRFSASGESESGGSSINSGSTKSTGSSSSNNSSSSRSSSRRETGGARCWFFLLKNRRKTQK
ncbi:Patatin-like phospholipase domain protein [Quillaja saponaria]|uniref:Patatin-like phospholipase domain protein n=1 Tax=Quillaja saponaria TaxID=32244 RepID=A0AAD7PKS2_QUISA|nr:Patatin-like phospholipase domain protein [Quillaja saponaria]